MNNKFFKKLVDSLKDNGIERDSLLGYIKNDIDGNEDLTLEDKLRIATDIEGRRIGDDTVGDVRISTVWLGHYLYSNMGGQFETMVFGPNEDENMVRYKTKQEAIEGHTKMVELYKNKTKDVSN